MKQRQIILSRNSRFKNLDEKDISYIKAVHADNSLGWDERMSMLISRFGVAERTIRRWIKKLGFSQYKEIESEEIRQGKLRKYNPKTKRYIITWAQNATPVHLSFWENIKIYAEFINAEIGVIQGRYQNPTSLWTKNMQGDEWWDEHFYEYELDENGERNVVFSYLDGARHNIHPYLDLLSDIKIRPTAVNPLSGLEGISGDRSSIIGHPRVHLKSLPVLQGHPNKLLLTTGACTIKNYTDTKSGKKAEFHHTYGFVVVEIKDDLTYYVRQVTAVDDGSFTDLKWNVKNGEITEIDSCAAYVLGDIHGWNVYEPVMKKTTELFDKIPPRRIVLHDLPDGESVNPHNTNNPIELYERYKNNKHLVSEEIDNLYNVIEGNDLLKYKPIISRSNHDYFFDRWIQNGDWKKDIPNAKEYMEYALALLNGDAPKGIIAYILDKKYGDKITTLDFDDSFKILGWELAQHGHIGNHGSRGSVTQFRKLNTKIIVAHAHTPAREDGCVVVGTYSKLRLGYNLGASGWMHVGAIVHNDGKVQQIVFMEDGNNKINFTTLM